MMYCEEIKKAVDVIRKAEGKYMGNKSYNLAINNAKSEDNCLYDSLVNLVSRHVGKTTANFMFKDIKPDSNCKDKNNGKCPIIDNLKATEEDAKEFEYLDLAEKYTEETNKNKDGIIN